MTAKASAIRTFLKEQGGVTFLVTVGITLVFAAFMIYSGDYDISRLIVLGLYAFFIVGGAVILHVTRNRTPRVEVLFLCVFVLMGILNLIALPMFAVPDSYSQYLRVYEVSHGQIVSSLGSMVPFQDLPSDMSMPDEVLPPDPNGNSGPRMYKGQPIVTHTMALYSPVAFLPATIGFGLASLLQLGTGVALCAARIANLVFAGAVLYWSIKTLPFGKAVFAFTALTPFFVQLYASLSADVFTICLIYALVAYVLKLRATKQRAALWLLALLVLGVSMAKIVYLPVCLIALLIPRECFGSKRRKGVALGTLAVAAVACNLIWLALASGYLVDFKDGVDSKAQVQYMLTHIPSFFMACLRATVQLAYNWLADPFGRAMNAYNALPPAVLPSILIMVYVGVVFLATEKGKRQLDGKARALIGAIVALVVVLTFASLYVQWTPVGDNIVDGIQGRYFIPLLPLTLIAIRPYESGWAPRNAWVAWFCLLTLVFIAPLEVAL